MLARRKHLWRAALAAAGVVISVVLAACATAEPDGSASAGEWQSRPVAVGDPVIAAAGDIACDPASPNFNGGLGTASSCRQKYTSDLLVNAGLAAVLPLGDTQYECGGYQAFLQSYDPSWGRVKAITYPVIGNHEYLTSGGTDCNAAGEGTPGYFDYFGARAGDPTKGYYSFNIGSWHLVALNSSCSHAGGCGETSPQGKWLKADLLAHPNYCVLAFWHIPLFSSGGRASQNTYSLWKILYDYDADVILTAHDHIYERFAPQTHDGVRDDARGLRQFIVGTGGGNHTSIVSVAANSEVRNADTFGVLKLTLRPTGYDWQFVPETGKTFSDAGSTACHGANQPMPTPTPTPTSTRAATPTPDRAATVTLTPMPTRTPATTATPTPFINISGCVQQIITSNNTTVVVINNVRYTLPPEVVVQLGSALKVGVKLTINTTRRNDTTMIIVVVIDNACEEDNKDKGKDEGKDKDKDKGNDKDKDKDKDKGSD